MNRWHAFTQILLARLREFYREPHVLFWVYGFPMLLAFGLGLAFSNKKPEPPLIDVAHTEPAQLSAELADYLREHQVQVHVGTLQECEDRLYTGATMLLLQVEQVEGSPPAYRYRYDDARAESVSARHQLEGLLARRAAQSPIVSEDQLVSKPGTRYIDFLLPGLIGINLMGGGMWGVGFVIVDMRVRKLLKRLLATPMRHSDYLFAIISARMLLMVPEMLMFVLVGAFVFHIPMRGSPLLLAGVIVLGACAFSGLGLLIACRAEKTESVSGLMNLVMLPMWLMSGTFFRSSNYPDWLQPLIQALPLTQLNHALREVMLNGYSLSQVGWRLGILATWGLVTFFLAVRWFRWT